MIKKYRKKPVEIEAIQWTGHASSTHNVAFFMGTDPMKINIEGSRLNGNAKLLIQTLEGIMEASEGDYIIKGIKGEFYPCKPDIFELTYESV